MTLQDVLVQHPAPWGVRLLRETTELLDARGYTVLGAKQHTRNAVALLQILAGVANVLPDLHQQATRALAGDSNDDEHDALFCLKSALDLLLDPDQPLPINDNK